MEFNKYVECFYSDRQKLHTYTWVSEIVYDQRITICYSQFCILNLKIFPTTEEYVIHVAFRLKIHLQEAHCAFYILSAACTVGDFKEKQAGKITDRVNSEKWNEMMKTMFCTWL